MPTRRQTLLGLSMSCLLPRTAISQTLGGQTLGGHPPNLNPSRLHAIVEYGAREAHAKAVLFGVWAGRREILTGAIGNSMTTEPATTHMHYRIGGIAETFMSTMLLILVERGLIGLDDTILRWFPRLPAADRVTVRMLVGNTAGYIDYVTVDDFIKRQLADPFRTFTDDDLIDYSVRGGKMNFPPGASQQYSHTDNVILGQVIQRATGRTIGELYEQNIFEPLGMRDTHCPNGQDIQAPVLHAFTKDRRFYEDCTYWNPSWGSTPAMATSNIHDLGKWGPILGKGRLISRTHFEAQIAPTSVGKGQNRRDRYFAYGFGVVNGWIVQNPNINGYSGGFAHNLSNGVTIVVEATKSETSTTDTSAFDILRALAKCITPESQISL